MADLRPNAARWRHAVRRRLTGLGMPAADRPGTWLAGVLLALGLMWLGARALGPARDPWLPLAERAAARAESAGERLSTLADEAALHGAPAPTLEPPVQVRLTRFDGADEVALQVTGLWRLLDDSGALLQEGSGLLGSLRADGIGLQIGPFLTGRERLVLAPAGDDALRIGDERYSGSLEVGMLREDGRPAGLRLVLHLPLEQYVLGVVCGELATGARGTEAAQRAQAVAARSWALWKLRERKSALRDHSGDQVFRGTDWHTAAGRGAVETTRGLVLCWDGDLLPAFFHANCAGHTADAEELGFVSASCPPLRGAPDPACAAAPAAWRQQVPAERLDAVASALGLGDWLRSLHALQRDPGGRMLRTRFLGSERHWDATAEEARLRLRLPSTVWTNAAVRADGALLLEGRGSGHGVGLCQEGAQRRARAGEDWRAILAHYYPGAELRPLTVELLQ